MTTSTVATRVSKYKDKAPKISDADLSSEENGGVAESSFINPREKFGKKSRFTSALMFTNGFGTGSGVIREVGLKRLLDDDLDGDDDLLSKSSRSAPKRGRFMRSLSPGIEKTECQMCKEILPVNFLDTWKNGEFRKGHIPMLEWMDICTEHKAMSLREEWMEKGYPKIDWQGMKKRIENHYKAIEAILHGEIESPFMAIFQQQEKDVRGNPILLLRKDHRLQYPGYYGPRGANIM